MIKSINQLTSFSTYKVIIVDLHHGSIRASTQTLDLQEGEQSILGSLTILDTQLLLDGLHNLLTTAEHARSRSAKLDKELSNLLTTRESTEK